MSDSYSGLGGVYKLAQFLWAGAGGVYHIAHKQWVGLGGVWRLGFDDTSLGTLTAPTWDGGSPSGFTSGGVGHISFAFSNPDGAAETQLWMNDSSSDGGSWTLIRTFAAGSGGDTLAVTDVSGIATGDVRWFYLVAHRHHYTDSAQSDHAQATWGDAI